MLAYAALGWLVAVGSLTSAAAPARPAEARPAQAPSCHVSPPSSGDTIVTIAGDRYRFPAGTEGRCFGNEAAEVGVKASFRASVIGAVVPVTGWAKVGSYDIVGLQYLTLPSDLFQWRTDRPRGEPPVRGPVTLVRRSGGMQVWSARHPEIAMEDKVYLTFDGRDDLYGECTERDVGDWMRSCDIWWKHGEVMHGLGLPGDILVHAPAIADAYAARVVVRP